MTVGNNYPLHLPTPETLEKKPLMMKNLKMCYNKLDKFTSQRRRKGMSIPKYRELFNPLLTSLKDFGGSATNVELENNIAKKLQLKEKELAQKHLYPQNSKKRTELQYQLAWARTYLKAYGLIDSPQRGVWILTAKGKDTEAVDPRQVCNFVTLNSRNRKRKG